MKIRKKLLSVIPALFIAAFFYFVRSSIINSYPAETIKQTLMRIIPIFLGITLILILLSSFQGLKYFRKLFKKIDRKTWITLSVILLFGLTLRTCVAPHTHRVYYDEDIYLNVAQNIVTEGRAILCNYGTQEKCFEGIYNKQPFGFSFLISILFYLFGVSEAIASHFVAILSSFTIIFVFLIAYLIFNNKKIALFSSLLFSIVPLNITWAPTTSAGSTLVFFTSLAIFGFLSYFKTEKNSILLFSFSSLAYAIQIRPEGGLLIPIVGLMFLLLNKRVFTIIKSKKFLLFLIIFCLLIVPHLLHLNVVSPENWGSSGKKFSTEYLSYNLKTNTMFFFENTRFPIIFTFLSLLGLYQFRKYWRQKSFLVLWFLIFFGIYLVFYAGSFNYGVDERFSLNLYIPMSILAGCGAFLVEKSIEKRKKKVDHFWMTSIFIILFCFLPFVSLVSSVGEKAWDARLAHDFLIEKLENLDDSCWIFTHVPSVALVNGKNSLQAWYAQNPEIVDKIFEKTDCVLFYEEYWCNADPWKSGPCKYFHDNFDLLPYDTITERGKTFTLYFMKRRGKNVTVI